ncbi:MAG: GAF domain-containing protein [Acidobacteria bacterium]|nr:GAF domain-containing protein [Acidobacteriota bacterium]
MLVLLVVILLIIVGFFVPIPMQRWPGVLFKFLLLFIVLGGGYYLFTASPSDLTGRKGGSEGLDAADQGPFDGDPEQVSGQSYGEAFKVFSKEYVALLRNALVGSCAGIYLGRDLDQLDLVAGDDDKGGATPVEMPEDVGFLEKIMTEKKAVLENSLPEESFLPGFEEIGIQSYVGVPLEFMSETLGILAVGSRASGSFSEEDVHFLKQAARVLARVMTDYHRGLRWEKDQQIYRLHLELEKDLRQVRDEESAFFVFAEHIKKLFPFNRMTLSIRDGLEGEVRQVYGQMEPGPAGMRFPLDEGLTGWVIKRNAPLLVEDLEKGEYIRPRYMKNEKGRHGLHCFLGIPAGNTDGAWGCLSLESAVPGQYAEKGKEIFIQLALPLASALERIYLKDRRIA